MKVNIAKTLAILCTTGSHTDEEKPPILFQISTEQGFPRVVCILEIEMPIIRCCGLANQPRFI